MFSNPGTLSLLRTPTELLIVLQMGGLFGLNVEMNGKTCSVCFSLGFLSLFGGISRAFFDTVCYNTDRVVYTC